MWITTVLISEFRRFPGCIK